MGALIAIVANSGQGKTVSACTFPKDMLMIDMGDRGFESVRNARDTGGKLVVPNHEKVTLIEIYREGRTKMSFKSFASTNDQTKKAGETPEYTEGCIEMVQKYEAIMDQLFNKGTVSMKDGEFIAEPEGVEGVVEKGPFTSLVIDPMTAMFRHWKGAILNTNKIGDLRRGDYLALESVLANQFIPNLKSLSDKIPYIILTFHEDQYSDDKGNLLSEFPVGPSKSLGTGMGEHFDNLWRMEVSKASYTWRTKNHGLFKGAKSRWDLPERITPATFATLETILKERK